MLFMKHLDKIPALRKLANQKGTPLKSVDFIGSGVLFVYDVGNGAEIKRSYTDPDWGIEEELKRLRKL